MRKLPLELGLLLTWTEGYQNLTSGGSWADREHLKCNGPLSV